MRPNEGRNSFPGQGWSCVTFSQVDLATPFTQSLANADQKNCKFLPKNYRIAVLVSIKDGTGKTAVKWATSIIIDALRQFKVS